MTIIPLTIDQERKLNHIRKIIKVKQNKIKEWLDSRRYIIIEGVQKKGKTMVNLSETTHVIEDKDIMTEVEMEDLHNWYFQESASAYWKALEIKATIKGK